MPPIRRLKVEEVLNIRSLMSTMDIAIKDSFGAIEPLNRDRLESAVQRQFTGVGEVLKYRTIAEVCATLFYGIVMNHAFENGNKRTGVVALLVFLDMNRNLLVDTSEDDIYDLARSVASHEIVLKEGEARSADSEVDAISHWIGERTRSRVLGDHVIRFKYFQEILQGFGCTFERPDGNYIKIRRGSLSVSIGYPRSDFDVSINDVKKVRRQLRLSEIDGVDSSGFYDFQGMVDVFVNKYRNLLKRLADL